MASPTRRLPKDQRRATLVRAASELFARRGYDHASLDELAAQAGVTKPIVYRHFASKKALYLELLARHRDELLSTLADGMQAPGPLSERISQAADRWFAYVETHPFAWAMMFNDVTGDPEIRTVHATMRETARNAVAGLLRADEGIGLTDDLIMPVAEVLRSAMTGLATWWLDHPDIPRSTLVRAITQTTGHGLIVSAGNVSAGKPDR
jgi:AcrR family transcriptional regulator